MKPDIVIKIDNQIWMDAFEEEFNGFVIHRKGHTIRIPLYKVIEILKNETDKIWNDYIFQKALLDLHECPVKPIKEE